MKKLTLEEIRLIQLEIMDDVHTFCVKKNIRYSLAGGSLLGAVKHKGFVPMDDDIDIMMPRPDYERFISEYASDSNLVVDMSKEDSCREQFSKVCRKGTCLVDPILHRTSFMVFIDVCPIDGAPTTNQEFLLQLRKKIDVVPKVCAFYKVVPNHKLKWFCKYLLKRLLSGYAHGCVTLKQEIRKMLISNSFESSPYAAELLVVNDANQILEAGIFKEYILSSFEGREYFIIKQYDKYLLEKYRQYGHYLSLPALQAPVHNYEAYEIDV